MSPTPCRFPTATHTYPVPVTRPAISAALAAALTLATAAHAQPQPGPRLIEKADYRARLHGLWLAQCVANWTGIKTEGRRNAPPFLTDADWGTNPFPESPFLNVNYVLAQDPWQADDDTDIEYVYLHLLTQHAPAARLTPPQIAAGWIAHCNHDIWVSNAAARALMTYAGPQGGVPGSLGALPPSTAFAQAFVAPSYADQSLMIDAQLTTELFGAFSPGLPAIALDLADLPIRTTATGYSAHAAQFYVVLYALATQVDRSLPPEQQTVWLTRQARKFIPDTSKSADIIDTALADYLANPDPDNWERTRDLVYDRYQLNAAANGFRYRAWYESSVNLATGVIALLYGRMDLPRTIRIGTLTGWDSDNGTATMGGLLGLVLGYDQVVAAFAPWPTPTQLPSDRYWASRTRDNLPDRLPLESPADDTLTMMADRCMAITERMILDAGGLASATHWLLPPGSAGDGLPPAAALLDSPTHREHLVSSNAQTIGAGGSVACSTSVAGVASHWSYGSWQAWPIGDAHETNFAGRELQPFNQGYCSTQRGSTAPLSPAIQSFTVQYASPRTVAAVRFIEGDHFHATGADKYVGGWFESVSVELLISNQWTPVPAALSQPLDPWRPFQTIDLVLDLPIANATAVRLIGLAGGGAAANPAHPNSSPFVTLAELDALLPPPAAPPAPTYDRNSDGRVDAEDLYAHVAMPVDLDRDAIAGPTDTAALRAAVRWMEPSTMTAR